MSTEYWTLSKNLCRCCHAEGNFKSLAEPCIDFDQAVIYAEMMKDCFDINLVPVPGILTEITYTICDGCISRLYDAVKFKSDVAACEEKFKELCNKNVIKVEAPSIDLEIKTELPASYSDDDDNSLQDENNDNLCGHDEQDPKTDLNRKSKKSESRKKKKLGKSKKMKEEPLAGDGDKVEAPSTDVRVKSEMPDPCADDAFSLPDENNANFDDTTNYGYNKEGSKILLVERVEKKSKKLQSQTRKVKSQAKKKVGRPKKMKEEPPAEGDGDKRKERSAPKFRLNDEDYTIEGDTFSCARCEKKYEKFFSLRFHVKTKHYKIPRFACLYCKKDFMTPAPLTIHKLEAHNIDERFKCNACKGMFNTKVQLRKHKNNFHMLGERYTCDLCDYESFSFEGMYKHKFKHKTSKDHQCRFCRKAFVRKTTLALHERIHTGDRRKVCTVCGQAFVQKASLNYHMTKYHPEVNF